MVKKTENKRRMISDPDQDGFQKRTKSVLGGDFLTNDTSLRQFPFLMFITFLLILYIANGYYAESNTRDISNIKMEIKELRFEYISTKSKLMQLSKQSELVKLLEAQGIKESTTPPYKIVVDRKQK